MNKNIKVYGLIGLGIIISIIALFFSLMQESPSTPLFRVDNGLLQVRNEETWQSIFDMAELESEDGISVESVNLTDDGALAFRLSDGTVMTTEVLELPMGEPGLQGLPGAQGNGIESAAVNELGELLIEYTNGTTQNLGSITGKRGPVGATGEPGEDGINDRLQFAKDLEASYQFLDLAYDIDDQVQYIQDKLNQGYIPVASSEDLSAIASLTTHAFAAGTPYEMTVTPKLDDNYIQVESFNVSDAYMNAKIQYFEGIYDGGDYELNIIRDAVLIDFEPNIFEYPKGAQFENIQFNIEFIDVTYNSIISNYGLLTSPSKGVTLINIDFSVLIETNTTREIQRIGLITSSTNGHRNVIYAENIITSIVIDAPNSEDIYRVGSIIGLAGANTNLIKDVRSDIFILGNKIREIGGVIGYLVDSTTIVDTYYVDIIIYGETASTGHPSITKVGGVTSEINDSGYLVAKNGFATITLDILTDVGGSPLNQEQTRINYIGGFLGEISGETYTYVKDITAIVDINVELITFNNTLTTHEVFLDELSGLVGYIDDARNTLIVERVYSVLDSYVDLENLPIHTIDLDFEDSGSMLGLSDDEAINVTILDSFGEYYLDHNLTRPSGITDVEYGQIGSFFGVAYANASIIRNSYGYSNHPEIPNVIPGRLNIFSGLDQSDESLIDLPMSFELIQSWLESENWLFVYDMFVPTRVIEMLEVE